MAGRPLLAWSLEAFTRSSAFASVVVAAPAGHEAEVRQIDATFAVEVVTGGASRADSVREALSVVSPEAELVAVHDAARPLVTEELIDALVAVLAGRPDAAGVVPVAAVTDTIKRAGADREIVATEDRRQLWAAQTPQVFRADALRAAYAGDPASVAEATDDAMLVEANGEKLLIEPVATENFKVTTKSDLSRAALLLEAHVP